MEYSPHPTLLMEEENRETAPELLSVRVPTSQGSESPSATPAVRLTDNVQLFVQLPPLALFN